MREHPAAVAPAPSPRPRSPILGLAARVRSQRAAFAGSLGATIVVQSLAAACSALSAWAVSRAVVGGSAEAVLAGLAAALVAYGAMMWVESWVSHALAYRVLAVIRSDLHAALERVAPVGLGRRRTGDVAARVMGDVEVLEWFYAHTAAAAIAAVVVPGALLAVLVAAVGPGALLLLIPMALLVAVPVVAGRAERAAGGALREALSRLKVDALMSVEGLRDLVLSGAVHTRDTRVQDDTRRVQRRGLRLAFIRGAQAAGVDLLLAGSSLMVLVWLVSLAGQIDPVLIPVASALTGGALAPVTGLAAMLSRLGEISSAAQRCTELLTAPDPLRPTLPAAGREGAAESAPNPPGPDASGGPGAAAMPVAAPLGPGPKAFAGPAAAEAPAAPALEFAGVGFAYPDGVPVLRDVSFQVPAGSTVALVGASGAGKTTLAHLAVRFADPDAGTVRLDGRDLRTMPPDAVRERVGLIPQHGFVFAASVAENLRLGCPDAPAERLWEALALLGLRERIAALPDGLEGVPGERGSALSGGERQRLALARAFVSNRPVLVMDEPLANVDPEAETTALRASARLREGRTTLLIAHRLAGIRAADSVVFLADGTVAAAGTHEELLTDPRYRSLLAAQLAAEAEPTQCREQGEEVTPHGDDRVR